MKFKILGIPVWLILLAIAAYVFRKQLGEKLKPVLDKAKKAIDKKPEQPKTMEQVVAASINKTTELHQTGNIRDNE